MYSHNVLVLSLDNLLCELLCNRTLPVACLSVSADSIFSNELQLGMWLKRLMVRAVLLRVLNYWGYDVASYDSDAVLLKNPQVLYDERPHIDLFSAACRKSGDLLSVLGLCFIRLHLPLVIMTIATQF